MIRVLVADDHPVVRKGLADIVSQEPDMTVAGEAADGLEVLQLARQGAWDAVVLDLSMPGRRGLDLIKQLRGDRPALPILVLSVYPEEHYAVRVLRAGADGYLNKEAAPECLVQAIRKVAGGGKYVGERVAEQLAATLAEGDGEFPHERLSDREFQVLVGLGRGKSVGQVAEELFLSPRTVGTYRARVMEKMGMRTSADLMRYVIERGLVRE